MRAALISFILAIFLNGCGAQDDANCGSDSTTEEAQASLPPGPRNYIPELDAGCSANQEPDCIEDLLNGIYCD